MNEFSLKPNLLLGVSSAAAQIDGGGPETNWTDWAEQGKIKDGSSPLTGADHWTHWREDILLMHRMGIQCYRFGIEWARVEPEEGRFDEETIAHIKEELMLMMALGIKPLITLHHFSNPLWFEQKKGWEDYENVRCFLIYVEHIVKAIGHLASEYITINEPNVYAANAYRTGSWPPGKKSLAACMNVMSNLSSAHIKAYRLIHDVRRSLGFQNTKVGFAIQLRVFEPKNRLNPAQRTRAAEEERLFQTLPVEAMLTGEYHRPMKNNGRDRAGMYGDFYAVNYDTRITVSAMSETVRNEGRKNDLGWEIYPEGITQVCRKLMKLRPLPIYITANGTCDLGDSFRCRYIYDHLKLLCESKLPVKRFYYSRFLDGFEWLEGNYARFGLIHTNFDTMERSVKRSGTFYSRIIEKGGVTEAMYNEFVAGADYHF